MLYPVTEDLPATIVVLAFRIFQSLGRVLPSMMYNRVLVVASHIKLVPIRSMVGMNGSISTENFM